MSGKRRFEPGRLTFWLVVGVTVLVFAMAVAFRWSDLRVLNGLREDAAAQCYRVNFLRYEVDLGRYARWQADEAEVHGLQHALRRTPETLRAFHVNQSSTATRALVRAATADQRVQLARLKADLRAETFLPFTDCRQAVDHPTTYVPSRPKQFGSLSQQAVRHALAKPPQPGHELPTVGRQ